MPLYPASNETYMLMFADLQKLIKYWDGDTAGSMGKRGELNELIHTVAIAAGWGLNPPEDATYIVANGEFDPEKKYRIEVPVDVPAKGFWSISVYNKEGFFVKNKRDAYVSTALPEKRTTTEAPRFIWGRVRAKTTACPYPVKGVTISGASTLQIPPCSTEAGRPLKRLKLNSKRSFNNLPITPGWNYIARMYRPRQEILNNTWSFPVAKPVK